jgi:hypothetical protein
MEELQCFFEKNSYVVVKDVLCKQMLDFIAKQIKLLEKINCFEKNVSINNFYFSDNNCRFSFVNYSSLVTETLLLSLQDKIEKIVNKYLFPSYSYLRIYYKKSELLKHTDRPSCEFSASLCISIDNEPWPIWFETKHKEQVQIILNPGDLVIYKGEELPHWRNIYNGSEQIQVFLHYIDQNGKNREYKFDKRPMLAIPK